MTHTFDIRFGRSTGIAALFAAAENNLRWKGRGSLRVDTQGVSIDVKPGLLSAFTRDRSRRIRATELTEVYREGNLLRLAFSTPDSRHMVLPLWAQDHEAAAQIVRLMPTTRTIELEDPRVTASRYRIDWRLIAGMLLAASLMSLGGFALHRLAAPARNAPPSAAETPDTSFARAPLPAADVPASARSSESAPVPRNEPRGDESATPDAQLEFDGAAPVEYGGLRYPEPATPSADGPRMAGHPETSTVDEPATSGAVERRQYPVVGPQLEYFERESARLRSAYQYLNDRPTPAELQKIEAGWWELSVYVYQSGEFQNPAYYSLTEAELAASRAWRRFLAVYADGIRANNREQIEFAMQEFEFAEDLTRRVRLFD